MNYESLSDEEIKTTAEQIMSLNPSVSEEILLGLGIASARKCAIPCMIKLIDGTSMNTNFLNFYDNRLELTDGVGHLRSLEAHYVLEMEILK